MAKRTGFSATRRTVAVVLLFMAGISLLLPYIDIRFHDTEPIAGRELTSVWLPMVSVSACSAFLVFGAGRIATIAACCSAIAACISLYVVYGEIEAYLYNLRVTRPIVLWLGSAGPGIGFFLLVGCSILLFFVSLLAIRNAPPPRTNNENELIDEIPDAED